jgi:hypothetical protein
MGYGSRAYLHRAIETFCRLMLILLLFLCAASCTRRSPETEKNLKKDPRILACAPGTNPDSRVSIAITSLEVKENKTTLRLVAYSRSEALDFHLPVYLMSRWRWVINDQARAYLLDEKCREYRLNGRKSTEEMPAPRDGIVELKPRTAFETILEFPPLEDDVKGGVLVYDQHVIPFSMLRSGGR